MIQNCEYCGKAIRGKPIILFSGSVTGSSTATYLCVGCGKNKSVIKKLSETNDWILNKMDGL